MLFSKVFLFQVSKSTAVANEAVGNVRTVRAFAMEPKECQCIMLFSKVFLFQVSKSTAVANEAVGNVRTVRAFAMEPKENE